MLPHERTCRSSTVAARSSTRRMARKGGTPHRSGRRRDREEDENCPRPGPSWGVSPPWPCRSASSSWHTAWRGSCRDPEIARGARLSATSSPTTTRSCSWTTERRAVSTRRWRGIFRASSERTRLDAAPPSPACAANQGIALATGRSHRPGHRRRAHGLPGLAREPLRLAGGLAARPVITSPAYHLGASRHMDAAADGLRPACRGRIARGDRDGKRTVTSCSRSARSPVRRAAAGSARWARAARCSCRSSCGASSVVSTNGSRFRAAGS